jgi:hypothetical protein
MAAKEERREALSIPEARKERGSEHGASVCAGGAAQAGLTEGAEWSLHFARKRMLKEVKGGPDRRRTFTRRIGAASNDIGLD